MTAESRARYEGIRPWFSERFPNIPPELTNVYAEFIGTLNPVQASIELEIGNYQITRADLVKEMKQGTELGKLHAESLFEGAFGSFTPEMRERVKRTPELLVKETVHQFRVAIDRRNPIRTNLSS